MLRRIFHKKNISNNDGLRINNDPDLLKSREKHISEIEGTDYDVVIIGAGATGAGIALDCATRGLKCVVIDGQDFGSGTSSKSTKLIHGGIRYLAAAIKTLDLGQLTLVTEGLEERAFMRWAGGKLLTNEVGMLVPLTRNPVNILYNYIGGVLYTKLGNFVAKKQVKASSVKVLGRELSSKLCYAARIFPFTMMMYDGAHIDHRTVLHVLNTAAQPQLLPYPFVPANLLNYCQITGVNKDSSSSITSIVINANQNKIPKSIEVKGKVFINCTGPYSDLTRHILDCSSKENPITKSSSGIHLAFPPHILDHFGGNTGILIPKATKGSVCFILPFRNMVIAGTTDRKEAAVFNPMVTNEEKDYLCNEIATSLNLDPNYLKRSVTSQWKGFRPLVNEGNTKNTTKSSRSHKIVQEGANLWSVIGGKWTSYRNMSEDCLDQISKVKSYKNCITKNVPWSASLPSKLHKSVFPSWDIKNHERGLLSSALSRQFDVDEFHTMRLVELYGYNSMNILTLGKEKMMNFELSSSLLRSELEWAVEKELACTTEDIIFRRNGVGFLDFKESLFLAPKINQVLAEKLSWTPEIKEKDLAHINKNLMLN